MAPAFRPKPAALKLCRTALPVLYTAVRAFSHGLYTKINIL